MPKWNEKRADQELERFVQISQSVPGNKKAHLKTGGKQMSGEYCVDRYTSIKNEFVQAHMACHVKDGDSDPIFQLKEIQGEPRLFTYGEVDAAFDAWRNLGIRGGAPLNDGNKSASEEGI